MVLDAGDDAVHADGGVSISDGTILINSCYEGIEALTIDVSGGEITIYPTDDGFNANGGTGDTWIHISGGTITIINENGNDADGLDSNGDICISGGTVRISLINNGTNSAIDAATENGGSAQITGGTMIACGSYSMAEGFDSSSTQCSVLYNISSGAEAGTDLSVETEDGTLLLAWEVPCSFSSAIVSCPEMTLDETYTITAGDLEESVTLTETAASAGDAQSNMAGGNMNHGGMLQAGGIGAMDGMPERPDAAAGTEQESTDHQAEDGTASAQSVSTAENGQEGGPMQGERGRKDKTVLRSSEEVPGCRRKAQLPKLRRSQRALRSCPMTGPYTCCWQPASWSSYLALLPRSVTESNPVETWPDH